MFKSRNRILRWCKNKQKGKSTSSCKLILIDLIRTLKLPYNKINDFVYRNLDTI